MIVNKDLISCILFSVSIHLIYVYMATVMFLIVMFLFYYNYVPCAFFIIFMLLVILIDIYYLYSV